MKDFLSTGELVDNLNIQKKQKDIEVKPSKPKIYKNIIFGSIVFLAVLHLLFMGLPLFLKNKTNDLLGYHYVIAVTKDQQLDEQLIGKVVRTKTIDMESLRVNNHILVYNFYGGDQYYWEVEVIDIDPTAETLRLSFDGVIKKDFTFNQVEGEVANISNFIGVFYYTGSTPRGFIIMIFLHAVSVYGIYYAMFNKKKSKRER